MTKSIFTFGKDSLPELKGKVNPLTVLLVVEGSDNRSNKDKVYNSFIKAGYTTMFNHKGLSQDDMQRTGFVEYTLEQLEALV